ncbi:MAG: M50 family metallopeptidase, partial [Candidatus Gracilibacteria bacterium]|nr:M50 family metallopeptidase [Candidatus Gracilibacteria bacterium]
MTILLGILLALLIFSVVVFFHELGHFALAKWFGVRVEEFGIGIPPRAKKVWQDRAGTIYTLNWLPIGGFVKMKGEDMEGKGVKEKDSLVHKSFWQQSGVILAGVFMNFVFATFIFSGLFMVGVEPLAVNTKFETVAQTKLIPSFDEAVKSGFIKTDGLLLSPLSGSIAQTSGILDGDVLLRIDGVTITKPDIMISKVKSASHSLIFDIKRGDIIKTVSILPQDGKIGSYVGYNVTDINKNFRYQYGFLESIGEGVKETYWQSRMTLELLGTLLSKIITPHTATDRDEAVSSLGGPIAVGNLFVNLIEAKATISVIVMIAALISINLGVFNLLPFPALDGGRFFFLIINKALSSLFGKKSLVGKIEHMIHIAGFSFLILV